MVMYRSMGPLTFFLVVVTDRPFGNFWRGACTGKSRLNRDREGAISNLPTRYALCYYASDVVTLGKSGPPSTTTTFTHHLDFQLSYEFPSNLTT